MKAVLCIVAAHLLFVAAVYVLVWLDNRKPRKSPRNIWKDTGL